MSKNPRSPRGARLRRSVVTLPLTLAPLGAFAQVATPTGGDATRTLETVTVTAERRTEDIKDVPISISTLSGEKLDALTSDGQDIRALSGRVPSLNIESSFGRAFPRFYIRGYGNTDFHLNASQPVSLVYDDVVQENPILKGFPIFDVDQVEVLAGPQGTLFGRNTPAGVVKVDSVKPTDRFEGYLTTSYGRFTTVNVEGALNLPLGDMLSARLSISSQHRNDYVGNSAPGVSGRSYEGYDDEAARFQLLFKPSDRFTALLAVNNRQLAGTARLFRANIIKPGTNDFADNFDPKQIDIDGQNKQSLDTTGVSLRLRYEIPDLLALNSITGYEHVGAFSRGDVDGGYGAPYAPPFGPGFIPFSDETSDAIRGHRQLSQEFRVESLTKGPLSWQGGLYLYNERFGIDSLVYDTLFGGPTTSVQAHQTNSAWAVFGSAGYKITEQLGVRAGLRYTRDRKFLTTASADTPIDTSEGTARGTSDSKVSWDGSVTYAILPNINAYVRVANGFRASSIFPASAFGPLTSAPAETNTSYEAGFKGDLLDRRVRFSIAGFHYSVKNQQLSAVGGTTNVTTLVSASRVTGDGFEGSIDAYLTDDLLVTLNGSYNKTKIKDGGLVVAGCAACTVLNQPGTIAGTYRIDGNALPQAPKWIGNVTARYGFPLSNGGEAFVMTDWSYRSEVNFFLYESTEFTGKSLLLGGLRAGYNWGHGKYEAAVFGRNITNQVKVVGGIDFNNLTGFINEPRIWGAQFKAQF